MIFEERKKARLREIPYVFSDMQTLDLNLYFCLCVCTCERVHMCVSVRVGPEGLVIGKKSILSWHYVAFLNKCLLTPERELTRDQSSKDTTKIQLGESLSFWSYLPEQKFSNDSCITRSLPQNG